MTNPTTTSDIPTIRTSPAITADEFIQRHYVGRVVSRVFPVSRPLDDPCDHPCNCCSIDQMWLEIQAVEGGLLVGQLLVHPEHNDGYGPIVRFLASEVVRVWVPDDGVEIVRRLDDAPGVH